MLRCVILCGVGVSRVCIGSELCWGQCYIVGSDHLAC